MTVAFCLLTREPTPEWLTFLEQVKEVTPFKVMVMCDNTTYKLPEQSSVRIIQYSDEIVRKTGYKECNVATGSKDVIAWDKAIFHFCEIEPFYDYVFFVEDDVFIPTPESILTIHNKYKEDLICHCDNGFVEKDKGDINVWHWRHAYGLLNLPWYASMVCAIRVSNALLQAMKRHVNRINRIPFLEIVWNTLAHQNNLSVKIIPEFEYIIYDSKSLDYTKYLTYLKNNNWLHPIKESKEHPKIREYISMS